MMNRQIGVLVVIAGVVLIVMGVLIYSGAMRWFGKLPGDISYKGEEVQVYVPIVSMLAVSVVLSVLFYFLRRFL